MSADSEEGMSAPELAERDAASIPIRAPGILPHIWLIDDSETDGEEYKYFLEQSGLLRVDLGQVLPTVEDYLVVPLDPSVRAVIVDQFLAENTGVPYEGVDVAEYLRVIAPALPVFVLTNFAGDLEEQTSAVDMVITKGTMRKHADTYIARILRGIGRYQQTLDERQRRLQELIDQEINDTLIPEDAEELSVLRRDVERAADLALKRSNVQKDSDIAESADRTRTLQELLQELRSLDSRLGG